jgi:predicted O-linked N-acetylglucosamine transferase (SPINDLY family)
MAEALAGLRRHDDADRCYARALALAPDSATIWKRGIRGRAARAAMESAAEQGFPEAAIAQHAADADAYAIHAGALGLLFHLREASDASDRALALDPAHVAARRIGIHARLHVCDWRRREEDEEHVRRGLAAGSRIVTPFDHRCLSDSEEESLALGRLVSRAYLPHARPLWNGERYRHRRTRIAYVSTDLGAHPVGSLMVGCFEHHDRSRFEIISMALRADDGSGLRRRIQASCDRFIDVHAAADADIASLLRRLEVDIAVDLNGHSGARRPGIFARRPAPVQVNYLGYPGTSGAPFMDIIIGDPSVIPVEHEVCYSERVVRLPHTYLPADSTRRIAAQTPTRAEAGLPEIGIVFACFNNTCKIGPAIFDVWMRLLHQTEGAVLWLRSGDDNAIGNLRREAAARGVRPERLVFAPRVPSPEAHLARLRVADLFLDTLPYNAHTTAIEALWAGLPVLTCAGRSFQGRVGAGLLHAIGLPELVTSSIKEYESLALALARQPERLAMLKATLSRNRTTTPLFDTAQFTRDLEAIYLSSARA